MNKEFSVYLDLCRFIAAVVVVLAHLIHFEIAVGNWSEYLPTNGRDAVIVFFLLSGLVIYYTVHKKSASLSQFIAARATRIYSVALPVILLTVMIDSIGLQFNPQNYTGLYQYEKLYIYIPLHLAFLGEIWTLSEQPFTVPPYWSLGFEVWYYALFAVLFYYRGIKLAVIFGLLFLFVGYKLWILFPIWLSGIVLLRLISRRPLQSTTAWWFFLLPVALYILFKQSATDTFLVAYGQHIWPWPQLSLGSASKYLSDYVVCVLFFCHLYGARFINISAIMQYKRLITVLASYTFTLYLAHAPVMKTIHHNMDIDPQSIWTTVFVLIAVTIVTLLLGLLTEQRKHLFLPYTVKVLDIVKSIVIAIPILHKGLIPNRQREL
jgi:peptidoglycan/LPS O-acetylase OafA/YrhL